MIPRATLLASTLLQVQALTLMALDLAPAMRLAPTMALLPQELEVTTVALLPVASALGLAASILAPAMRQVRNMDHPPLELALVTVATADPTPTDPTLQAAMAQPTLVRALSMPALMTRRWQTSSIPAWIAI